MSFQKLEVFGNVPQPRFGHTTTVYAKGKIVLFGGATGNTGEFSITDATYTFNLMTRFWSKVETTGSSPSPRAAHAAAAIDSNQIVIYGGATGSGGLASDHLYLLEFKDNLGVWSTFQTNGRTPGKRYGHIMCYAKPHLVVFGGNTAEKSVNDCWVINIERSPSTWQEISSDHEVPCPRVYHSAALCSAGSAAGMIVIFGGRSADQSPLNDAWGLRRHRNGNWDWVKAPYKSKPRPRYQHTTLFMNSVMLVIGGRTNNVGESLPLETYDTENSEWHDFATAQRFRHGSWIHEDSIYIYGGFELNTPNVPTDALVRISLADLFQRNNQLFSKLPPREGPQSSITPMHQPSSAIISPGINTKPTTPKLVENPDDKPRKAAEKKLTILEPVIGRPDDKPAQNFDIKRPLTSKQDIPYYFLNYLLQPKNYMNVEGLKFIFKPYHIMTLCDFVEEILMEQPNVLQVRAPLKIFGDIHGQYSDLMSFFALYGSPFQNGRKKDIQNFDYLFLGDFVDRGSHSLETICLLLALKALFPRQVHLIRGNHEDYQINCSFGFSEECGEKCMEDPDDESSVFRRMNRLFDWLPLAAVVEDKILCLHGGIGSAVKTIEDIASIKRPLEVYHEVTTHEQQVVLDILWSDPTESDAETGIVPNTMRDPQGAGNIVKFGPDVVHEFLKKNDLSMIIRAHECVMDGFERFAGGALITLFSATDYCKKHKNAGAILIVKTNLQIVPKLIYPSTSNAGNWIEDEDQLARRPPTPPRWKNQAKNY